MPKGYRKEGSSKKKKNDDGGLKLPKLGVKEAFDEVIGGGIGALRGIAALAPGGEPAGAPAAAMGKGLLSSLAGTSASLTDLVLPVVSRPLTDRARRAVGELLGEEYTPKTLAQQVEERGILGPLIENVGNLSLLGAGATAPLKLGAAGRAASAGTAAGRATRAGFSAADIARATEAAAGKAVGRGRRMAQAGVSPGPLREAGRAGARAAGKVADPTAVARRTAALNVTERLASPYRSLFNEAVRPLARASTARVTGAVPEPAVVRMWRGEGPADSLATEAMDSFGDIATTPTPAVQALLSERTRIQQQLDDAVSGQRPVDPQVVEALNQRLEQLTPQLADYDAKVRAAQESAANRGRWFTPDREVAERYLPREGGTLKYADVPADVAQSTRVAESRTGIRENLLPPEIVESARAFTPETATPLPAEIRARIAQAAPIPEWAERIVEHLPLAAVRAMYAVDRRLDARQVRGVLQERLRAQQIENQQLVQTPEIQAVIRAAGEHLVNRVLPDGTLITPTIADDLIGGTIIPRLTIVDALERATGGNETVRKVLTDIGARTEQRIPDEWLVGPDGRPTDLGRIIDETVENTAAKLADERLATLTSTRVGTKGLEGVGATEPSLSRKSPQLLAQATRNQRLAEKLEATKLPQEKWRLVIRSLHDRATVNSLSEQIGEARRGIATAQTAVRAVPSAKNINALNVAVRKEAALRMRRTRLNRNLASMQRTMLKNQFPAQAAAEKLRAKAVRQTEAVARQLADPNLADTPDAYKPVWDALKQLHKQAETSPELAAVLEELPQTWDTVVRLAAENGFDPVHVRSFSRTEVNQLIHGAVRLGDRGRLGKVSTAGTRRQRKIPQVRDKSFSALLAAVSETTREKHANALVDFIEQGGIARRIGDGGIPEGGVPWDPARNFLLGTDAAGNVQVEGFGRPTMWVPKEVVSLLDNYQRDFNHAVFRFARTALDPWRLFMLTLSPRWYVNNFVGNLIMATKEGVRLQDWVQAWRSYRRGGGQTGRFAALRPGSESFGDVTGAVVGGLAAESGVAPSIISYPRGMEGLRLAHTDGLMTAAGLLASRIRRGNEVVDQMARAAVYHANIRKGMSVERAIERAHKALVDYMDLSPFERQVVRGVVPFYAFQKGVLKLTAQLPADHPAVVGVMSSIAQVQDELNQERYGGDLPEFYRGLIEIPGLGVTQTRGFNPFQDSAQLLSPQGIAAAMNPLLEIGLRNALGAPEGGYVETTRIDEFGRRAPDTRPLTGLTDLIGALPPVRVAQLLPGPDIGYYGGTGTQDTLEQTIGVRRYSPEEVQKLVQRLRKAEGTGAPRAKTRWTPKTR